MDALLGVITDVGFGQAQDANAMSPQIGLLALVPVNIASPLVPVNAVAFDRERGNGDKDVNAPTTHAVFRNEVNASKPQPVLDCEFDACRAVQAVAAHTTENTAALDFAIAQEAHSATSRAWCWSALGTRSARTCDGAVNPLTGCVPGPCELAITVGAMGDGWATAPMRGLWAAGVLEFDAAQSQLASLDKDCCLAAPRKGGKQLGPCEYREQFSKPFDVAGCPFGSHAHIVPQGTQLGYVRS